jgi:hypothetical protein
MNKKTKMYVGVGVVALAAYYFYMQSKKKETTTPSAKFVGLDANKEYYRKKREQGVTNIRRRK